MKNLGLTIVMILFFSLLQNEALATPAWLDVFERAGQQCVSDLSNTCLMRCIAAFLIKTGREVVEARYAAAEINHAEWYVENQQQVSEEHILDDSQQQGFTWQRAAKIIFFFYIAISGHVVSNFCPIKVKNIRVHGSSANRRMPSGLVCHLRQHEPYGFGAYDSGCHGYLPTAADVCHGLDGGQLLCFFLIDNEHLVASLHQHQRDEAPLVMRLHLTTLDRCYELRDHGVIDVYEVSCAAGGSKSIEYTDHPLREFLMTERVMLEQEVLKNIVALMHNPPSLPANQNDQQFVASCQKIITWMRQRLNMHVDGVRLIVKSGPKACYHREERFLDENSVHGFVAVDPSLLELYAASLYEAEEKLMQFMYVLAHEMGHAKQYSRLAWHEEIRDQCTHAYSLDVDVDTMALCGYERNADLFSELLTDPIGVGFLLNEHKKLLSQKYEYGDDSDFRFDNAYLQRCRNSSALYGYPRDPHPRPTCRLVFSFALYEALERLAEALRNELG